MSWPTTSAGGILFLATGLQVGIVGPFSEEEKKGLYCLSWAKEENRPRLLNQAVIPKLVYISFTQDIIHRS